MAIGDKFFIITLAILAMIAEPIFRAIVVTMLGIIVLEFISWPTPK